MNEKLVLTYPRILVIVGQVLNDPWLSITREGQFPTWLADASNAGVPVRHSFGTPPGRFLQPIDRGHEWLRWHGRGRTLVPMLDEFFGRPFRTQIPSAEVVEFLKPGHVGWRQKLPDLYLAQRWKVLGSLRMAIREEFDFVYFTTASSYIRVSRLLEVCSDLPTERLYAGTQMHDAISGEEFASGASRIMSRDVVMEVVEQFRDYRNDVMEDVGLGRLINSMGVQVTPLPSINIDSIETLVQLTDKELLANFHFRMRSGSHTNRADAHLMNQLHRRFQSLESGD